jgi:hypothetical protein
MTPTKQEHCCLQACVASILDRPLHEIPVVPEQDWIAHMNSFLKRFNVALLVCDAEGLEEEWDFPETYCILMGPAIGGEHHAVVGKVEDGRLLVVFNPGELPLARIERIGLFIIRFLPTFVSTKIQCRICSHEWMAVVEVAADGQAMRDLECPNCGGASGDVCQ